jgi:sulfite reductase (NADPH) hemoprotein beta-component
MIGFEVIVGGGLGRTPMIAKKCASSCAKEDLLAYLEAIMRVYNRYGRRDNKYKARIKILVHETGIEEYRARSRKNSPDLKGGVLLPQEEIDRITPISRRPKPSRRCPQRPRSADQSAKGFVEPMALARRTTCGRIASRATRRSHLAEAAGRRAGRRHDPTRCDAVADIAERYGVRRYARGA